MNQIKMKTLLTLLVLFLFPILISFNSYGGWFDKTVCVKTDAQERNGIIYLPNETEPFTGNNLCEYENGQNKSKGEIKDGKKDGEWIQWFENGLIDYKKYYEVTELPNSLFDILILKPIDQHLIEDTSSHPSVAEKDFISKKSIKSYEELEYFYISLNKQKLVNEIVGIKYYEDRNWEVCLKDKENLLQFFSDQHNVDKTIFSQVYFEASGIGNENKKRPYLKDSSIINYIKNKKDLILDIFCEYHPNINMNAVFQSAYPFYASIGIILTTKKYYFENYKISERYVLTEINGEEFKNLLEEYDLDNSDDILSSLPNIDGAKKITSESSSEPSQSKEVKKSEELTDEDIDRIQFILSLVSELESTADLICTQKVYIQSTKEERKQIYDMFRVIKYLIQNNISDKPENEKYFNDVGLNINDVNRLNEKFYNCF